MRTRHDIGHEPAVEGQPGEQLEMAAVDAVAERERALRSSVEQESHARVNHADERALDGRLFGQTLAAEERMRAREWEIERTRQRWDREQDSEREAHCRSAVAAASEMRRVDFERRAASVDPWADPERADARTQLSRATLGAVNREAGRLAATLDGWSTAAVSRLVARRVVDGLDVPTAVLDVCEMLRVAPGHVIPITAVGEVGRREVDLEGRVATLWKPSHPAISQVGLLEDATGRIKFTAWRRSRVPMVREGERVRLRGVARNWYRGRVSVALTGWSRVVFLEREVE